MANYTKMSNKDAQKYLNKNKTTEKKDTWLNTTSVFDDGYQFLDLTRQAKASNDTLMTNIKRGVAKIPEGILDAGTNFVGMAAEGLGYKKAGQKIKDFAQKDLTSFLLPETDEDERYSVFGQKSKNLAQGVGNAGGNIALSILTGGSNLAVYGAMGASAYGQGMNEALAGGATNKEALLYGAISGGAEVGSEMLFGGLGKGVNQLGFSKGLTELDDIVGKGLSKNFKSQTAKNIIEYLVKATGEGTEEVLSGLAQAWGKSITFKKGQSLDEILKDEDLLDQFIMGAITSGIVQVPGLANSVQTGRDYISGNTQTEQKIVDAAINMRIAEQEKDGNKLTNKEKNKIAEQVQQDLEKGYIDTKIIEDTLGFEEGYNKLKSNTENAIGKNVTAEEDADIRAEARERFLKSIENDDYLLRSYEELNKKFQNFTVSEEELNKMSDAEKKVYKDAIESGLDNTGRSHDLVKLIAKISSDKGINFEFSNNEKIANSSFALKNLETKINNMIEKKQNELGRPLTENEIKDIKLQVASMVNGFENNGTITLNMNSSKTLSKVIGHEITHILEGTDMYDALAESVREYAKSKNDARLKDISDFNKMYSDVENANLSKELTADLVGDYIFTDQEFVNRLSTQNRNLFQKIFDEIKYMLRIATAGSKEARQLEKAKKMFEEAYRQNSVKAAEQQNAASPKYMLIADKGVENAIKTNKVNEGLNMLLSNAQELQKENVSNEEIKRRTGWFYDPSNKKWLLEISDKDSKLDNNVELNKKYDLEQILEHEDLYEAYPELKNQKVIFKKFKDHSIIGSYNTLTKTIKINSDYIGKAEAKKTLLHELQHRIQQIEGMEQGTNQKNLVKYYTNLGEIEASDVEERSDMNLEELLKSLPEAGKINPVHPELKNIFNDPSKQKQLPKVSPEVAKLFDEIYNNGIEGEYNRAEINKKGSVMDNISNKAEVLYNNESRLENRNERAREISREELNNSSSFNVKYSLSQDNQGRELSKEQQEYFKDSKVRDENGRLLEVYHGSISNEQINVFDTDASPVRTRTGVQGTYFTSNGREAQNYRRVYGGDRNSKGTFYKVYLNITNPLDITNDIEKYEKQGMRFNEAKQEALKKLTPENDGVIFKGNKFNSDEYVVFNSNQIKSVDNTNPTDNPDIRYSLSPSGEMVDNEGNKVTLDASNTGNTGTLMAIHNLNEDKMKGILELGGFPYPSIAITKPSEISHEGYGDISVLFNKDTINPELSSKNKVYSRDAYTPRFPHLEYKVNSNEKSKIRNIMGNYDYRNVQPGDNYISDAWSILDNLEDNINNRGLDKTLDDIKNNTAMKYIYLKNNNPDFNVETKNEQFSNIYSNETLQRFLDNYKGEYELNDIPSSELSNYVDDMVDAYKQQVIENSNYDMDEETLNKVIDMKLDNLRNSFAAQDNFKTAAYKLQKYGNNHQILDTVATKEKIDSTINQQEYEKWIDDLFVNIIEKKGLRNNKDYYTSSGNPRSFEQLHEDYTLDNVVKILDALDNTGTEGIFTGIGQIAGNASMRFNNIEDIKANENLLTTIGSEEYSQMLENIQNRLSNIDEAIMDRGHENSDNYFIARDNLDTAISDAARLFGEGKKVDANKLTKMLNEYGFNPTLEEAQQIVDMFSELRQLPTQYFEAKPKRAVGLDEVQQVVIPSSASQEIRDRLQKMGIPFVEYNTEVEGDRQRVINQFDDLKFSLSNGQEQTELATGSYNVPMKDYIVQESQEPIQQISQSIGDIANKITQLQKQIELMNNITQNPERTIETPVRANLTQAETEDLNMLENYFADNNLVENIETATDADKQLYSMYKELINKEQGLQETEVETTQEIKPSEDLMSVFNATKKEKNRLELALALKGATGLEENLQSRVDKLKDTIYKDADIMDLFYPAGRKSVYKAPERQVITKSKARDIIDKLKGAFINENVEIDNLARDYDRPDVKWKGDMLNNAFAEGQNDVTVAQTNNYGKAIGKSVEQLFQPAIDAGLYDAFNDYLINYSNIDRHLNGKGSKTPYNVSENLVKAYEKSYPEFKEWAKDVWNYGKNTRDNMLEAGLIDKNLHDGLGKLYPHYVPYISDVENINDYMQDVGEIKPRGLKKAYGKSGKLLPVQEALTKYTFSMKKGIRQNALYNSIIDTLRGGQEADLGTDDRTDYTNLDDGIYRDRNGAYLTAYKNGIARNVKISEDLYNGLRNDLKNSVKNIEERLSFITNPLQKLSNIRRNILTSWSPTFPIKNALKDFQGALFNSKHTFKMLKNYPGAIKELSKMNTPEVRQFIALYGSGNLMGQFDEGSYKSLGKNKFLRGISKANEVIELAPRYAEFKASLESGSTIEEAMYNAREVTTNFSRGGTITKALNRNGFTFLNSSVQGFDKFVRNFSGENGAKGVVSALLKAVMFGVAPALFNDLVFGSGDDKDEDYEALPDYIKDNYYLIKTGDNQFVRIPKGREFSVFGSAGRRALEASNGEENAFDGFLKNAWEQIGVGDLEQNNIIAPLLQAYGSKNGTAWYGGDIVPTRLQDKPAGEQTDASIDSVSTWLGEKLGISPYKLNYVIDQYTGGVGDIILPLITPEATSEGSVFAPITDQFTSNSTMKNKYASDFYTKLNELKVINNGSKATDEDKLRYQYMSSVSGEMSKLYAEKREIQASNLNKADKYAQVQEIQKQINELAKVGLEGYDKITSTSHYADVNDDMGYYKNSKGNWTAIPQTDIRGTESIGLTDEEKSTYFQTKNSIYNITENYKEKSANVSDEQKNILNAEKKRDIITQIQNSNLPDNGKALLYDKYYGSTDKINAVIDSEVNFDSYLDLQKQNFTADKDENGKSINGTKKTKVFNYINNMNIPYIEKCILAKLEYNSFKDADGDIVSYLDSNPNITYDEMIDILKAMGFTISGNTVK